MTREELAEQYDDELLFLDGHDDALIGVCLRFGQEPVALYDLNKIMESLMADGMDHEEAEEFFSFNMIGAWVGEKTPAFMAGHDGLVKFEEGVEKCKGCSSQTFTQNALDKGASQIKFFTCEKCSKRLCEQCADDHSNFDCTLQP